MSNDSEDLIAAQEGGEETLEFNLRLDGDGRTTYDPTTIATKPSSNDNDEEKEPDAKKAKLDTPPQVDYSSKTTMTNLAQLSSGDATKSKQLDELLFDCEITDSGLLPRTFWISADSDKQQPRCYLEKMALEIFHHHVPSGVHYDKQTSGAEWWVQIRPSPPAGRYSMHSSDEGQDGEEDMAKNGISFHWDKDEDFRLLTGGSMYIHPHISTVTYLTDIGAPTMVLSKRVDPMSGAYISDDGDIEGLISFPKQGKHLSFDGRYLHAAPSDLLSDGLFEEQIKFDNPEDKKQFKLQERRHRRVSFLVNIWLNYKPYNVNPFPDTMISNLSKIDLLGDFNLFDKCGEATKGSDTITLKLDGEEKIQCEDNSVDCESTKVDTKKWPMGSCSDEFIQVPIPAALVKGRSKTGGNVQLIWRGEDVKLSGTTA